MKAQLTQRNDTMTEIEKELILLAIERVEDHGGTINVNNKFEIKLNNKEIQINNY
jgi:hypothetical protein